MRRLTRRIRNGHLRAVNHYTQHGQQQPGYYVMANGSWYSTVEPASLEPALMRVNHDFRREVGDIFYGARDALLSGRVGDASALADFAGRAVRDIGRAMPFASLTLNIEDAGWARLEQIMPLVAMLRTTDLDVGGSFTMLSRGSGSRLAAALRRGLEVGVRGRREGWDPQRLEREVRVWAEGERASDAAVRPADAARQQRAMRPRPAWYETQGRKRKR